MLRLFTINKMFMGNASISTKGIRQKAKGKRHKAKGNRQKAKGNRQKAIDKSRSKIIGFRVQALFLRKLF